MGRLGGGGGKWLTTLPNPIPSMEGIGVICGVAEGLIYLCIS